MAVLQIPVECQFLPPPCTMAASQLNAVQYYLYHSPVWGWRGLAPQLTWKVQACWRQQSCSHLLRQRNCSFVLSSLQPQGMLLLACLIASLIKTWLAVSNMISPAEHLELSQQICVCVLCTPWAAKTSGSGSGCHESQHTAAAHGLWLCSDVPKPSSSLTSLRSYPSIAGRTELMDAHCSSAKSNPIWLCYQITPGSLGFWECVLLSFSKYPPEYTNFHKDSSTICPMKCNFRAASASDCVVEFRYGLSRVSVITGFSVLMKSIKVILHF